MPRRSVESRLQSLQDKRAALENEIRKIQAEKAREVRKRQRQREAILGRVMYQLVAEGSVTEIPISSEQSLLGLLDSLLTRQRERQLFGLAPLSASKSAEESDRELGGLGDKVPVNVAAVPSATVSNSAVKSIAPSWSRASSRAAVKQGTTLPTTHSQDELMGEFNL